MAWGFRVGFLTDVVMSGREVELSGFFLCINKLTVRCFVTYSLTADYKKVIFYDAC